MANRQLRRMAGGLAARLSELGLEQVPDPRAAVRRWPLRQILTAVLTGLMAGCRGLSEVEELSESMGRGMRRVLKLRGRIPDTTMRDVVCKLRCDDLRGVLHRAVHMAHRRKALRPVALPFHVVAMDGKATVLPAWDDGCCQKHEAEGGVPYGLLRTVTSALVSAPGRPCIDVSPIPSATNEMGHFRQAFDELLAAHSSLFDLVSYDAGGCSEANGRHVVDAGKHYLFHLNHEDWAVHQVAAQMCDPDDVAAESEDVLDNQTVVRRRVVIVPTQAHWGVGGTGCQRRSGVWEHTRTYLRIDSSTERAGQTVATDTRFYATSLSAGALQPRQWLSVVRAHWGVENNNHHTFDVAFEEDDRPWIKAEPIGALAVLVLRRVAYTLLTLFRSVTQRSDEKRQMPWKALLRWVYRAVVAASETDVQGLRPRRAMANP